MNIVATILAAVIAGATVMRERRRSRAVSRARAEAGFVVATLQTVTLELRCGRPPLEAMAGAVGSPGEADVPAAAPLWAVASRAETMSAAAGLLDRGPPALQAVAGALRLTEASGTSLAGLVEAILDPLREQQAADSELTDALAGARSSANLLTALPLLGLLLAEGIGARPLEVLFRTSAGAVCLVFGTGLGSLGRLWTGLLVERARLAGQA